MRTLLLLATSVAAFGAAIGPAQAAAVAAKAPPAAQIDGAPAAAAAGPEAQVEALRERLLASQQTIATLERELAEEKNRSVALDRCRVKNGRLVRIGRQLVEGYQARYRQAHKDPFQLGRRRFEFELQALSEALYDAQTEVPPRPDQPPSDAAPAAPPAAAGKDAPPAAAGKDAPPAPKGKDAAPAAAAATDTPADSSES
ncbi:MAG: hypothetical protein K2X68_08585 [Novosphingobium sp.]|nr:hypothetical protein [Novosphingobium sp.]